MSNDIANKKLWRQLSNINQSDWLKAAQKLGLLVIYSNSGTSHYTNIRDPKFPDPHKDGVKGLISTITPNCFKQANEKIFKRLLKFGIAEDDIWRALNLL